MLRAACRALRIARKFTAEATASETFSINVGATASADERGERIASSAKFLFVAWACLSQPSFLQ
jgi:hypothetical protein